MPKASPSKPPLPKKPREPKEVKDVALNTMRVANYQAGEAGRLQRGDGGVQGRPAGAHGGQEIGKAEALGRRRRTGGEAPDAGAELLPAYPRVAARPHYTQPGHEVEAMYEGGMRVVWSYSALPGGETSGGEEIHGATFLVGRAVTERERFLAIPNNSNVCP